MSKKKNRNKKKLLIIILSIIVVIITAALIFLSIYYKKHKYVFKLNKTEDVVLNAEVKPEEYIKEIKNAKVKYNAVDTSTIGEKKITYIVTDKLFKKDHKYTLKINVIDNVAPVVEGKTNITVYVDSKIDLKSYIKATDNYDKELKTEINGDVDTSKKGTYKVEYTVTDLSGNASKHTITFTVKAKDIFEPITLQSGVVGKTSKGYTIENKNGATFIDGVLIANKTYPLSSGYGNGLTGATKNAFEEMKAAAALDGFSLRIGSGYRSYSTQKSIYKGYVNRDGQAKADTYSARPGHSEHQSGLAIDICAAGYSCITSAFNGTPPANWLSENAYKYGFILRYPNGKSDITGYKFESWHYRYVGKELAAKFYNGGNWTTMEEYYGITSKYAN